MAKPWEEAGLLKLVDFLRLLAGLLLFLWGISLLGGGLGEAAGEGSRRLFRRLAGSPLRGAALGARGYCRCSVLLRRHRGSGGAG